MNEASLYRHSNELTRYDAEQIYKEFSKLLRWRCDGRDRLLDVGCGTGDVLMDIVRPLMPNNFEKITGIDISPNMIEYARKFCENDKRCDYEVLDIATAKALPLHLMEQFDHVVSFYCMHWIQNTRQALKNIYNLLCKEGGDCLLTYLISFPHYAACSELRKSFKWSSIIIEVDNFVGCLYHMKDSKKFIETILNECGFKGIQVEVRSERYTYKDINVFTDVTKSICPYFERIPSQQHAEFINDILKILKTQQDCEFDENSVTVQYDVLIAYARK